MSKNIHNINLKADTMFTDTYGDKVSARFGSSGVGITAYHSRNVNDIASYTVLTIPQLEEILRQAKAGETAALSLDEIQKRMHRMFNATMQIS